MNTENLENKEQTNHKYNQLKFCYSVKTTISLSGYMLLWVHTCWDTGVFQMSAVLTFISLM